MKKNCFLILMLLPFLMEAQVKAALEGLKFEDTLSWQEIKSKAKAERKYILVDVYASWCGPCKAMDKDVYPSEKIGKFVNENFVSVKVQTDTTKNDEERIKNWYSDAHEIQQNYKVQAFPSFLFFSPNGEIVHRAIGSRTVDEFLELAKSALNPEQQYYTQLKKYKHGIKNFVIIRNLITIAKDIGDDIANIMAKDYKANYLDKLPDSLLFSKQNFEFISSFPNLINSKDRFFHFLFYEGRKVDSLLDWEGKSQNLVDYVIYHEDVYRKLYNGKGLPITKQPSWKSLDGNVRRQFGDVYADRVLLNSKITWYNTINDSALYTAHLLKKLRKYGVDNGLGIWYNLNAFAWEFFLYSRNRDELNEALKWSDSSIKLNYRAAALDTKANLLYKLGRKEQALEVQKKAVEKEEEEAGKSKRAPDQSFRRTLEKMKNNDPELIFFDSSTVHKPIIDTSVFGKWPSVRDAAISNDGRYVSYIVNNLPINGQTLVLRSTDFKFELEVINSAHPKFTVDSKYLVFKNSNDSLVIVSLSTKSQEFIPNVSAFDLNVCGGQQWLSYVTNGPYQNLGVRCFQTNKIFLFQDVTDYVINESGGYLLFQKRLLNGTAALELVDLKSGAIDEVHRGFTASDFIFNTKGNEIAFIIQNTSNDNIAFKKVLLYRIDGKRKFVVLTDSSSSLNASLRIESLLKFSKDGKRIFFMTTPSNLKLNSKQNSIGVDVWSYQDTHLQSEQLYNKNSRNYYTCVYDLATAKIIRLESADEKILNSDSPQNTTDEYLLELNSQMGDLYGEWNWNSKALVNVWLVSTLNGSKISLGHSINIITANSYKISSSGRYVIYYDPSSKNYFTYEIKAKERRNITKKIKTKWTSPFFSDIPASNVTTGRGVAGWLENDSAVFIYGEKDIFQIDPSDKLPPINLTNHSPREDNIIFSIAAFKNDDKIIKTDSLIISAFNLVNKNEGFYRIDLNTKMTSFELLSMQPYTFKGTTDVGYIQEPIIKAANTNVYVVRRMSAEQAPNYFLTVNFRDFVPLSNINPEENYNWITSELISYKTITGTINKGVLFKPANFNGNKRYPVIINYYERLSDRVHTFIYPEASHGDINIPYFVSNGYLVFTPDIAYSVGNPGMSAYNSIVGAAKYLSKLCYIESTKLAVQGHSFGGFETNFLITHTKIFAAALSASAVCDFISDYGSVLGEGNGRQSRYELSQSRIGETLWERPDLFFVNSPIFSAAKVTTPLLMMNNIQDPLVPFSQGVEFFTALRRLGKSVWMLQYDGESHSLDPRGNSAMDYTIRMMQFLDHYLKDSACPRWMLYGVPATEKGNPDAFQLVHEKDKNGKWLTPKEGGLLTDEEKKKVEALKHRKPITITIE